MAKFWLLCPKLLKKNNNSDPLPSALQIAKAIALLKVLRSDLQTHEGACLRTRCYRQGRRRKRLFQGRRVHAVRRSEVGGIPGSRLALRNTRVFESWKEVSMPEKVVTCNETPLWNVDDK